MPLGGTKFQYRLKQIDFDGQFEYSDVVDIQPETPVNFVLNQNYPNPFNPSTTIQYVIPAVKTRHGESLQRVKLIVYDVLGKEVATLVNKEQKPGYYKVTFDATKLASGMYIYKLSGNNVNLIKKMLFLK